MHMRARGNLSVFRIGMVLAAASVLAACTKGGQFDPTVLLDNDMFDNKKPIKGQREPVFPNGVPGIQSGIPADLYKGYQPPPDQAADNGLPAANGTAASGTAANGAATNIVPAAEEPPKAEARLERKPKPKPKRRLARAPAARRTEISVGLRRPKPVAQQAEQSSPTAWPAPPSTAQTQSSQGGWPAAPSTAAAQPAQTAWPAPPSTAAAQQSQSIWPAPPPTGAQ
jgi:hypothetical protein